MSIPLEGEGEFGEQALLSLDRILVDPVPGQQADVVADLLDPTVGRPFGALVLAGAVSHACVIGILFKGWIMSRPTKVAKNAR